MITITEDGSSVGPNPLRLLRLLQLVSPALPIGAFAYSQGLETAIDLKWLRHRHDVSKWIGGLMEDCLSQLDVPVFVRLYRAWSAADAPGLRHWNAFLLASRGAAETRAEDGRLGKALLRVLATLGLVPAEQTLATANTEPVAYATAFSFACVQWQIDLVTATSALLFAWAENQVSAAVRLVPLGQSEGQGILAGLAESVQRALALGLAVADQDIAAGAPGHAMACALHETQYSRLFRS